MDTELFEGRSGSETKLPARCKQAMFEDTAGSDLRRNGRLRVGDPHASQVRSEIGRRSVIRGDIDVQLEPACEFSSFRTSVCELTTRRLRIRCVIYNGERAIPNLDSPTARRQREKNKILFMFGMTRPPRSGISLRCVSGLSSDIQRSIIGFSASQA